MKRSEMLKLMWNFIQKVENDYDVYMDKNDTSDLLFEMEKAGMLPPPYVNTELGDHMDFYEINQWEEE